MVGANVASSSCWTVADKPARESSRSQTSKWADIVRRENQRQTRECKRHAIEDDVCINPSGSKVGAVGNNPKNDQLQSVQH